LGRIAQPFTMKLQTLKSSLARAPTRLQSLTTQTANPRPAGRAWQATRLRIQVRDHSLCCDCGLLWMADRDHVDHDIPRHLGGTDDDSNLKLRCLECHDAKTKREAATRARGG
jgi:5-methylcytosine-specific restriction protein A